jgi:hypothetical protein
MEIEMTEVVTGLFDSYTMAEEAVGKLEAAGIPHRDISILGSNLHGDHDHITGEATHSDVGSGVSHGAGIGAAVGGIGGLLAGLGLIAIPGVGPVVAAGWLVTTLVGAGTGAIVGGAAGGLAGGLTRAGVPEADAHVYAEGVRRGGTLVTARVESSMAGQARDILNRSSQVDIDDRRSAYQADGWSRFDEKAPTFNREQAVAERNRYMNH